MTTNYKRILIGGSPSSGSSLLRNILNRHPKIFCGPETSLFTFSEFYTSWNRYKEKNLKKIRNTGWYRKEGIDLDDPEFLLSRHDVEEIITANKDFVDFANAYFDKINEKSGKLIWAEKTPANARCFPFFLKHFQDSLVIHVQRNPYDAVASQLNRGLDHYYGATSYLLNVSAALKVSDHPNYLALKYEDLVKDPADQIGRICERIGVEYTDKMIQGKKIDRTDPTILKGWNYDETSNIGPQSIGRFDNLPESDKHLISLALQIIRKPDDSFNLPAINANDFDRICKLQAYKKREVPYDKTLVKMLAKQRRKEMLIRTMYRYPMHMFNYPIQISKIGKNI